MVAAPSSAATLFPFPVAAVPFAEPTRQALWPTRLTSAWLTSAWLTARWLDMAVDRLDLSCLAPLYRRRGSLPFSPLLMLKLALFCIAEGFSSPLDWADRANRDGPCRWLAWGIEPSVSACYSFRDRLGDEQLLELNRQALQLMQTDGITQATSGALDGTLIEANASRHHLVNQQRLERGLQSLDESVSSSTATAEAAKLIADFVHTNRIDILNVAGPRQSEWPDGYDYVSCVLETFLSL